MIAEVVLMGVLALVLLFSLYPFITLLHVAQQRPHISCSCNVSSVRAQFFIQ